MSALGNFPIEHLKILEELEYRNWPIISVVGIDQRRILDKNPSHFGLGHFIVDFYCFETNHNPNHFSNMIRDFDYKLAIDSGGLGDFYSHGYDVTIYQP